MLDEITTLARQTGKCPDRFWFQLNGKSAQENYVEQKQDYLAEDGEYTVDIKSSVRTQ